MRVENVEVIVKIIHEKIVKTIQSGLGISRSDNFLFLLGIQSIVYDALFFYVIGHVSFLDWCKRNNLKGLYTFIEWLFSDFEYISGLNLSYNSTREKVVKKVNLKGLSPDELRKYYDDYCSRKNIEKNTEDARKI